jgi:putative ABC transport system permease protein
VVFTDRVVDADAVRIRAQRHVGERARHLPPVTVPGAFVRSTDLQPMPMAAAVFSPRVVTAAGVESAPVALGVRGADITVQQERDVEEAVAGISGDAAFYVERGYQATDETMIVQLILGVLGAVLMLGGTLTATFLALSDARPDLATLSSVGASPRTRRGVAAAYALVVGLLGAVLGAAVGFIPGVAITYPLTVVPGGVAVIEGSGYASASGAGSGPFIDVPWLLISALVVALPLLTALIVALSARSRLPLVSRLD